MFCLRRRSKNQPSAINTATAPIPPTTPPTIAPVFVFPVDAVDSEVDVDVDVDEEEVVWWDTIVEDIYEAEHEKPVR